jgi:O-methyltransferase
MAMTAKARLQIASITAACDFSACELIADIGGGLGHLLQATLDAAPRAAGVLFDLPPVIEHAAAAASGRLSLQPGDFFTDPLPAAGTYLIMDVIHDWDDDQTVTLLSSAPAASTSSCWTRPDSGWNGSSRPWQTCRSSKRSQADLARRPGCRAPVPASTPTCGHTLHRSSTSSALITARCGRS